MKGSIVRRPGVGLKNLVTRIVGLLLALVAARLYTEQQTVYAMLYSLREFMDSLVSKV